MAKKAHKHICNLGNLLTELEQYTPKYSFNFQFWGEDRNSVYIEKGGIRINDFGGLESIEQLLKETLNYMKKIKATKNEKFERSEYSQKNNEPTRANHNKKSI